MAPTPTRDARRPGAGPGRLGGRVAIVGGVLLAALMAYALLPWGSGIRTPPPGPVDSVNVAVFFPDRADWEDFRGGARAVVDRGLAEVVADTTGSLTLKTARRQRPVRFTWHGVGGVIETREEARRLAESATPPVAVVGSANSLLTAALAVALRPPSPPAGRPGPLLLVPWATAIHVGDPAGGEGTVPLLAINPGRTFRFCANNRRLAELVVGCLGAQLPPVPPGRVLRVVDQDDGFSKDLADSFTRAIHARVPGVEIRSFDLREAQPAAGPPPARGAARLDREGAGGATLGGRRWGCRATARRGSSCRSRRGRPCGCSTPCGAQGWYMTMTGGARLQVLCGDSLRGEDLRGLVAQVLPFPVWAASSGSVSGGGAGLGARQVPAEVVSAVVRWADGDRIAPGSPESLRASLEALDLKADDPASLGRPLAFEPSGERRGGGVGSVLAVEPGRDVPAGFARDASGRWALVAPTVPAAVDSP